MIEQIATATHRARKDHEDSSGVWISNYLEDIRANVKMTFSEWRAIAGLRKNRWKIKAGQSYERSTMKQDGELYTFKCLPEIHTICLKYDLYAED